jgi:chemotaxis signal transduction protein
VRSGDEELGIRADVILGMQSIPRGDIQAPLPALTGIREKFLSGITKDTVIILDIQKLLKDESLMVRL